MNKSPIIRLLGFLLFLAGAVGLLLCAYGIIRIWQVKGPMTRSAASYLQIAHDSLSTTSESLSLASESLDTAVESLILLEGAVGSTGQVLESMVPVIGSVAELMGEDLPATIEATQTSLQSAQTSAKLIDDFLRALSTIPFFTRDRYNPDVPLSQSLGDISTSLDTFPETFSVVEENLNTTSENLQTLQSDIDGATEQIGEIQNSLVETQDIIASYENTVTALTENVEHIQDSLPNWSNVLAWVATLTLAWIGFAQIGLLLQGSQFIRK